MTSGGVMGKRRHRHVFIGTCLALMVNLGLFALAPLLLDQDVRTDPHLRETVDLRMLVRSKPSPEPENKPEMEEMVTPALTVAPPELAPEMPGPPAVTPPELAMPQEDPPPMFMDLAPPKALPPKPVTADPLPARPTKAAAVPVPAANRSAAGETAPVDTGGPGRGYSTDQVDVVPSVMGQPRPAYPYRARRRNIEGWVKIRFLVDQDGRVHDLTILAASPGGIFDAAVRNAVQRWRFRPGKKAGRPVDVWVETTIQFELD
jgi:protein TonB